MSSGVTRPLPKSCTVTAYPSSTGNKPAVYGSLIFFFVPAGQDTRIRFSVMPYPGDSGFTQWHDAMKMVARLPGGIPQEFRRRVCRSILSSWKEAPRIVGLTTFDAFPSLRTAMYFPPHYHVIRQPAQSACPKGFNVIMCFCGPSARFRSWPPRSLTPDPISLLLPP
jgi:hypothetical protein